MKLRLLTQEPIIFVRLKSPSFLQKIHVLLRMELLKRKKSGETERESIFAIPEQITCTA
jgi:hypothetical protein